MKEKIMTNFEKFKNAKERNIAFNEWCDRNKRIPSQVLAFQWLEMEYKEEVMNCLFCHNPMQMGHKPDLSNPDARISFLYCPKCGAESPHCENEEDVIPRYNEVVRNALSGRDYALKNLCDVCHILCPSHDGFYEKCEDCYCRTLLKEKNALGDKIKLYKEQMELRTKGKTYRTISRR